MISLGREKIMFIKTVKLFSLLLSKLENQQHIKLTVQSAE